MNSNISIEEVFNMDYYARKIKAQKIIRDWIDANALETNVDIKTVSIPVLDQTGFPEKFIHQYLEYIGIGLENGKIVKVRI
jgi:hypothetical protein